MAQRRLFDVNGNEVIPGARPTRSGAGIGAAIDTALKIFASVATLILIAGVGYMCWPQIRAAYFAEAGAVTVTTLPPSATELDTVKAQMQRLEAELRAARAQQADPAVIVQSVPAGQAPQAVTIPAPQPQPAVDAAGTVVEVAPQPIVIVHQVSADGAAQTVTGSGACRVSRVAARCGK